MIVGCDGLCRDYIVGALCSLIGIIVGATFIPY